MNIVFSSGTSLGGPIGGIIADVFGWRWSFGAQIPLITVSTLIVMFRFKLPHREISAESMEDKLKRVDFAGAFTLVCGPLILTDEDSLRIGVNTRNESWWE